MMQKRYSLDRLAILLWTILFVGLPLVAGPAPALAACANPTKNAGDIIYNGDHKKLQYCDGTTWISMGDAPAVPCAQSWTLQNTQSGSSGREDVVYGSGLFVAVGSSGNPVITSPDGVTWTLQTAPSGAWKGVTYGNGLFVAVSGGPVTNRVMTSPDGINWTARTAASNINWNSVTYGNGIFVAVAGAPSGSNRVMTSPDGITWTSRTPPQDNDWQSVTYGNGLFVAVSTDGTNHVMTSPDGVSWTARSAPTEGWMSVTYGNGLFVAVASSGGTRVMTSPDGITWTGRTPASTDAWAGVGYGNGTFVASASGPSGTYQIMTSPNGISWTGYTTSESDLEAVAYGNGTFVVVSSGPGSNQAVTASCPTCSNPSGTAGTMFYNADYRVPQYCNGSRWIPMGRLNNSGGGTGSCANPAHVGGTIMFNDDCKVMQYCDGASWHSIGKKTSGDTTPSAFSFTDQTNVALGTLVTSNSVTISGIDCAAPVTVSGDGSPQIRINGGSWTTGPSTIASGDTLELRTTSPDTCGGSFDVSVSVGPVSDTWTIAAGNTYTWTQRTSAGLRKWMDVASSADGTKLVAVAKDGYIYTSTDSGATWTERTGPGVQKWAAAASSADGTKLAVVAGVSGSGNRYIYTSTDSGATWTQRTSAGSRDWRNIEMSDDGTQIVANVFDGYIYTSINSGGTWTERTGLGVQFNQGVINYFGPIGPKIVSWADNFIQTSLDGGASWTQRGAPLTGAARIVSTPDGSKFVATVNFATDSYFQISTDQGDTWSAGPLGAGSCNVSSVSMSSSGEVIISAAGTFSTACYLNVSLDGGASVSPQTAAGQQWWRSSASSANGSKFAAVGAASDETGYIWTGNCQ
jgi:hypothetical protein